MNFKNYRLERLIIFIIILFLFCSWLAGLVDDILKQWPAIEKINKITHSFSTLSLMLLFIFFVNAIGWKWKIFKLLVDIPNLNGRYRGEVISSYNNEKKQCTIEIKQNASSIHIYAYFADHGQMEASSSSHSVTEEIIKKENGFFRIYYIFANDTSVLEGEPRNHGGTAFLDYYPDNKKLQGEYYNQRLNRGSIVVEFVQENLLGRLT